MATYLFTYNPNKWEWNFQDDIAEINLHGFCNGTWSAGVTKKIKTDDRFFLMRLGKSPRGIMASGRVTSDVFQDVHWADESKAALYVDVHFDTIIDIDRLAIFPIELLQSGEIYSEVNWTPQASGMSIPDDVAKHLEDDWAKFLNSPESLLQVEYTDKIDDMKTSPENKIKPVDVRDIRFDRQDIEVFKISDVNERIDTLQKHFFPRLELLIKDSLELVEEVYGIDPYVGMINVYRPNNRKKAVIKTQSGGIYVGRSGKRRNSRKDTPLAIKNAIGKSIYIHTVYLTFDVFPEGCIGVYFVPFSNSIDAAFVEIVRQEMQSNLDLLSTIFSSLGIRYNSSISKNAKDFHKLINTNHFDLSEGNDINSLYFYTESYFFPANFKDELWNLKTAFVGLYPLLDLFVSIGEDRENHFAEMLNKFHDWYYKKELDQPEKISDMLENIEEKSSGLSIESLENIEADREDIESKLDFNPENLADARERTNRAIVQRQGQSKFRSELLKAYGGQCAITDCDAEAALEAAHIFPYLGTDTNHVKNGLLLRADIHTLFDLYLISINPDTSKVVVSSTLLNTCYKELNGKSLKPPQDYAASPSPQALARHYETFLLKQNE